MNGFAVVSSVRLRCPIYPTVGPTPRLTNSPQP